MFCETNIKRKLGQMDQMDEVMVDVDEKSVKVSSRLPRGEILQHLSNIGYPAEST